MAEMPANLVWQMQLHQRSFFLSNWHLFVQNQQWKQQNNVWSPFKVNNRHTRTILVVLVSLLVTLNIFHTLFCCFYCWFWTSKCRLGCPLLICTSSCRLTPSNFVNMAPSINCTISTINSSFKNVRFRISSISASKRLM